MISVGIDLGTYSIKIAEVESTSKSYTIKQLQEYPLSLDPSKDRKIEIIDILRTVFAQHDHDKTHFVFALPQKTVSARLLQFPFRERFKVQKSVAGQLEDDLPLSQDDAVFETKVVRFSGRNSDVLALAAPKERVAELISLCHDCGLQPSLISCEAMCLANIFENWSEPPREVLPIGEDNPPPREAEVIVNIGHQNTQLLVYVDRIMVAVRNVDWGAKNMADAIGAKYSLNHLQAVRELQAKGGLLLDKTQGSKEQLVFSQVLETSILELVSSMRLKMFELQSEMNLQWTRGLILGGGSLLKNIGAFLTQNFEIPFNRFKQFETQPAVLFETNAQMEAVFGTAIGLAIEALKRPRNPPTNFLKGEFARQSDFVGALWERWGYTTQLAGAGFMIFLVFAIARESLSQRLLDESDRILRMQAEVIAGLKGKRGTNDSIRKFLNNIDKDAKNRKSAEKVIHINSALDVLNLMSAALPPNSVTPLEIKRISIDNETAEVHGYANSPNEISRVQQALQKLSANGKTENIPTKIIVPPGRNGFSYKFRVQRNAGG